MSETTLACFNEQNKAQQAQERLLKDGIHTEVFDESKLQKYWFLSNRHAAVKLRVVAGDFDKAPELLNGLDAREYVLQNAIRCPQCDSSHVEYAQFTRKFVTTRLVEIFCRLHLGKREFYCEDCQCTWPDHAVKMPSPWDGSQELDILGFKKKP
jgi:hypothetical protein